MKKTIPEIVSERIQVEFDGEDCDSIIDFLMQSFLKEPTREWEGNTIAFVYHKSSDCVSIEDVLCSFQTVTIPLLELAPLLRALLSK